MNEKLSNSGGPLCPGLPTTAVLLTFNVSEYPYNVDIPRELAGTAADKYQLLKLRLHQKTMQATRNLPIYGGNGHIADYCKSERKCPNSEEGQIAGFVKTTVFYKKKIVLFLTKITKDFHVFFCSCQFNFSFY